ncbi:unnamed protein product [Effrenium voratum]|nr:unnamed protein product [Effrenium voratum]
MLFAANSPAVVVCHEEECTLQMVAGWTTSWPLLAGLLLAPLMARDLHFSSQALCTFLSFLDVAFLSVCILSASVVFALPLRGSLQDIRAQILLVPMLVARRQPLRTVFASMRFTEGSPMVQARALQRALKQHNVELVIVSAHLSESITRVVLQRELSRCDAFLAFGTKDYGEDTGNPASTYKELEWWASWALDTDAANPFLVRVPTEVVGGVLDAAVALGHASHCDKHGRGGREARRTRCSCGLGDVRLLRQRQRAAQAGGYAKAAPRPGERRQRRRLE